MDILIIYRRLMLSCNTILSIFYNIVAFSQKCLYSLCEIWKTDSCKKKHGDVADAIDALHQCCQIISHPSASNSSGGFFKKHFFTQRWGFPIAWHKPKWALCDLRIHTCERCWSRRNSNGFSTLVSHRSDWYSAIACLHFCITIYKFRQSPTCLIISIYLLWMPRHAIAWLPQLIITWIFSFLNCWFMSPESIGILKKYHLNIITKYRITYNLFVFLLIFKNI